MKYYFLSLKWWNYSIWYSTHHGYYFVRHNLELDKNFEKYVPPLLNYFFSSVEPLALSFSILSHFVASTTTCCESISFSYRFHRRINFRASHISPFDAFARLAGLTFIFFLTASIFPVLSSRSWPFLRSGSFVRVIRGSRAAICHAQIRGIRTSDQCWTSQKGRSTRTKIFLIKARECP